VDHLGRETEPEFTYSDTHVSDLLRWLYESVPDPDCRDGWLVDGWLEPRWGCRWGEHPLGGPAYCGCECCRWLTGLLRQEEIQGRIELDKCRDRSVPHSLAGVTGRIEQWTGRARLTDAGTASAEELLGEDAHLAQAQAGRTEAVLTILLRWVYRQMTERQRWDGADSSRLWPTRPQGPAYPAPVWGLLEPVDSPTARGLRISLTDALTAAEYADRESLCILDRRRIELTGYGTRCIESYGGDYTKMTRAENGRGPAPLDASDLAQRIVNLVREHVEELEQYRLAERDAQDVADELFPSQEEQDQERIRDALTRLQGRVAGVGPLSAAVQDLRNSLFC
jgi:hypothetical protein